MRPRSLAAFLAVAYALPLVSWSTGPFPLYAWLLGEDGLYETAGTTFCLVAGVLFASLFATSAPHQISRRNGWFALFALGSLLLFVEEISWGQRLFGYGTPVWIQQLNQANETTIHNLTLFQEGQSNSFNAAVGFSSLALLGLLPWLTACSDRLSSLIRWLQLPLPSRVLACGVLSIPLFSILVQPIWIEQETGEVAESTLQLIWLLFALEQFREARGARVIRWMPEIALASGSMVAATILLNGQFTGQPLVGLASALGQDAIRRQDFEQASYYFESALGVRPQDPKLLTALASVEFLDNNPQHAVPLLINAIEADPHQTEALRLITVAFLQLGRPDSAGEYATQLCDLLPYDDESHYLLGVALFEQGSLEESADAFNVVLQHEPNHPGVQQYLSAITATGSPRAARSANR